MIPSAVPRALRFHLTPETIRVELEGAGTVFEDEAVLALMYDARLEGIAIVGWGRRALTISERLSEIPVEDLLERPACIVPMEEARWYDGERGLGGPPGPASTDPWEHHGEIVIVRPWMPGAASTLTRIRFLALVWNTLLAGGPERRFGFFQRVWLRRWAPIDVLLPERPADPQEHDRLVWLLRAVFGWRVRLDGAPARTHERARLQRRDYLSIAGMVACPAYFMARRIAKGLPALNRPTVMLSVLCLGMALVYAVTSLRSDPNDLKSAGVDPSVRASRRQHAADLDGAPGDYVGKDQLRLGAMAQSKWTVVPMLVFFGSVAVAAKFFWPDAPLTWYGGLAIGIAMFAGFISSLWLGYRLASARLSLGERGLTLHADGIYRRPLRIPYARIRHAAFRPMPDGGRVLRLVLHDGEEVIFGFPLDTSEAENQAHQKLLLDIEADIASRLTGAASYRTLGARSVAGAGQPS